MHERIIIPESVFSVAEDGSEYVAALREMDLDEIIGRASLMTDFMYSLAFDNNSALAERTLRPFLADLLGNVVSVRTQSSHIGLRNRGVRYDTVVRDDRGNIFNIEMQRRSGKYLRERMWYYLSSLTKEELGKGENYGKLHGKTVSTLFFVERDVFNKGKPFYTFSVRSDENFSSFGAGGLYIIVNMSYDGYDECGRVIRDLRCTDYRKAYYREFREALEWLKSPGGKRKMCETFEMLRKIGEREGREIGRAEGREIGRAEGRKEEREKLQNEYLKALIRSKKFTLSEISTNFNIPMDEILEAERSFCL